MASVSSLLASLLTCCLLPTIAQVTVEYSPSHVVEGENVLLRVDNLPGNLLAIVWYKEEIDSRHGIALYSLAYGRLVTGHVHSGRETLYRNGSLWIENVTQEDTGFYILQTIREPGKIVSNVPVYIQVHCK